MTRQEVAAVLALFAGAWPWSKPDEHTSRVWFELLADEPATCAADAARSLALEPGRRGMPAPGDFVERRRELARPVVEQQRADEAHRALPEAGIMPPAEARSEMRRKLDELLPRIRLLPGRRPRPQVLEPDAPRCRACGAPTDATDEHGPRHPWCIPFDEAYQDRPA